MASSSSNSGSGVPPGFRFHPTDEELLQYYLKKKIAFEKFDLEVIKEVDLNKVEPWELQERCRIGSAPQNEWFFFSHKDRKYPTGSRTNRATASGFWKATGRDKCIRTTYTKIGMRKTLVFYRGRAPHGQKTDWIMHEYRLDDTTNDDPHAAATEDGWVVCRVFKKKAFLKASGEGSSGHGGSADDLLVNVMAAPTSGDGLPIRDHLYRQASFDLHQVPSLYKSDLALHYPPLPPHQPYTHLPVQHLLSNHHRPPAVYGLSVLPGEGLDVAPCEPMQGHACEGRAQPHNEWVMQATRLGQDGGDGGRYRSPAPEPQVSQLPHHRGEMDLWGYGK